MTRLVAIIIDTLAELMSENKDRHVIAVIGKSDVVCGRDNDDGTMIRMLLTMIVRGGEEAMRLRERARAFKYTAIVSVGGWGPLYDTIHG
jgi:hypothetical protein